MTPHLDLSSYHDLSSSFSDLERHEHGSSNVQIPNRLLDSYTCLMSVTMFVTIVYFEQMTCVYVATLCKPETHTQNFDIDLSPEAQTFTPMHVINAN